jgi:hypothetical protein
LTEFNQDLFFQKNNLLPPAFLTNLSKFVNLNLAFIIPLPTAEANIISPG